MLLIYRMLPFGFLRITNHEKILNQTIFLVVSAMLFTVVLCEISVHQVLDLKLLGSPLSLGWVLGLKKKKVSFVLSGSLSRVFFIGSKPWGSKL